MIRFWRSWAQRSRRRFPAVAKKEQEDTLISCVDLLKECDGEDWRWDSTATELSKPWQWCCGDSACDTKLQLANRRRQFSCLVAGGMTHGVRWFITTQARLAVSAASAELLEALCHDDTTRHDRPWRPPMSTTVGALPQRCGDSHILVRSPRFHW